VPEASDKRKMMKIRYLRSMSRQARRPDVPEWQNRKGSFALEMADQMTRPALLVAGLVRMPVNADSP